VSFKAEILLQRLADFCEVAGKPARFVIAFSGGLDSTVLTHVLANSREIHGTPIIAVHVDHGLQADSSSWRAACESFALELGIDFVGQRVSVDQQSGHGPEASAREARYGAFRTIVRHGDWLLSAHHQDDQAETLLLNLMRGSGPAGLAGISAIRPFAAGWLARPLLDVPRKSLLDYAEAAELVWIDDPSNQDQAFDRNYLRHTVIPKLDARWSDAAGRLRRSAGLASEAVQLLSELAEIDRVAFGDRADRLALDKMRELSPARQRNVLRHVIRRLGLPVPGSNQLQSIVEDLIPARDDAQPLVSWSGAEVRRYRNELFIVPESPPAQLLTGGRQVAGDCVELGPGLGSLALIPGATIGLSDTVIERGLELRFRQGGEDFKPLGQAHTRKLKKLLQEAGVLPWMRDRLPLLFSQGRMVAVADMWIAADAASEPGTKINWINGPDLT
jgi:tRNA(Ile)-lysidine synthase